MHAAPPVRIACNGGASWALAGLALNAFTGAALGLLAAGWLDWRWPATLALALVAAAAGGVLSRRWSREQPAVLAWDGQSWALAGRADGQVEIMLDLGSWLLLRHRPPGRAAARWLSVRAADGGAQFHLWRAALYAPTAPAADGPRR